MGNGTQAVIFDMDGVIADTQKIHARVESEVLRERFGLVVHPDEISRRFSGVSGKDMFAALFAEAGRDSPYDQEVSDLIAQRFTDCADEFVGIEGTVARIKSLHCSLPLAVASASRPSIIDLILTRVGVKRYFRAVASSREVKRGKPAPDVFLLAAQRLNVEPRKCVVVEDGVSGMEAARAAGMRCIALSNDLKRVLPADIIVRDLRHVPTEFFS